MKRPMMMKLLGTAFFALFGFFGAGCATALPPKSPEPVHKPLVEERLQNSYADLSELTDAFSRVLSNDIAERAVYLDRTSIRDTITKDVSNFSAYLQDELESSFSKKDFDMVYDPSEANYLIGAAYRKTEYTVKIFFKYHKSDGSGRKSLNYEIELSKLPRDSFTSNVKSNARKLAANILEGQKDLKVYITPIKDGNENVASDFSRSFTARVKSEMVRLNRDIIIIDEIKAHKALSNTRGIKKRAKEVKNLQSSDAFFSNADSILEGQYFVERDTVPVNLYLKTLDGKVIGSSSVDIDKTLIDYSLENSTQKKLADLADVTTEEGDFNVKISTTKGGDFPIYYNGEKIEFHIQVGKPLFVYLYDIYPNGEIVLLYPYEKSMAQDKCMPGRLYTIPDENDDFEFEVSEPFGTDAVKIFASSVRLPIPELTKRVASRSYEGGVRAITKKRKKIQQKLSSMESIHPNDLVDYYRGAAQRHGAELYEDSLMLETVSGLQAGN